MWSLYCACKANGRNFQTTCHFGRARQCKCLVFLLIVNLTTFFPASLFHCIHLLWVLLNPAGHHRGWISACFTPFLLLFSFSALFTSLAIATDATSEFLYGHVWSEAWDIHPSWEGSNIFPSEFKKWTQPMVLFLLQIVFYVINSL
jgi:hypothetical protein